MRLVTIVLLFLTTPAYTQSVFLTYRQWEQLPVNLREIYVAGAFDTLSTVTTPEQVNYVKHYNECAANAALNLHELAENMKAYAETQPDLRDKPTPFALLRLGSPVWPFTTTGKAGQTGRHEVLSDVCCSAHSFNVMICIIKAEQMSHFAPDGV